MYGNASKIAVNATCAKYFNKIGLPYVYIALFRCLWVPGGGLEPFRRVLRSDGWLVFHTLSLILNGQNRNTIVNRLMSRINRIQRLGRHLRPAKWAVGHIRKSI